LLGSFLTAPTVKRSGLLNFNFTNFSFPTETKKKKRRAMDMEELCSELPNSRHPEKGGERRQDWKWFW